MRDAPKQNVQLISIWLACVATVLIQFWNLRIYAGLPERVSRLETKQELLDREAALARELILQRLTAIEVMLKEHMKNTQP